MLPFFYHSSLAAVGHELVLDEDNSRHIVQVLRMKPGETLQLTDGKGRLLTAVIVDDHKKKCRVRIGSETNTPPKKKQITVAISPVKNASRFEWFLEKAMEIGVTAIIPLVSERTERQQIRVDRLQSILVSALLQSQQTWLPVLYPPTPFQQMAGSNAAKKPFSADSGPAAGLGANTGQKSFSTSATSLDNVPPAVKPGSTPDSTDFMSARLIAHCLEAPRPTLSLPAWVRQQQPENFPLTIILIGPEGDFSAKEVEAALEDGYTPVTLGDNRLRTETAGVVAATLLCISE